uniref:lipoyl(octanoyl) transferase n=1 Tax=Chromera velia CCMP2878 TaxID=1169474 RepID=A0A0G4I7H1_9ALVE|eukprot:Cvel_11658.t1-p1 / transcript=Cvel_11658.t1 / gene=Cvel_11658 / organism=Chromera_velia_CCMP2878 / gene_product=Plastidial lipoyltransferase 2, putative / transcript_product=Plastidial lipoyltransferase 2, putative / location=Cvel_scaffold739:12805-15470(-) / protein_length=327 / sequence_SO=supercontig / SO=protein_coding / is_pseudo=false
MRKDVKRACRRCARPFQWVCVSGLVCAHGGVSPPCRSSLSLSLGFHRQCTVHDFRNRAVPYRDGWRLQRELRDAKVEEIKQTGKTQRDDAILLQHSPVYTLGTASTTANLRFPFREEELLNPEADSEADKEEGTERSRPFDLYRIERGGEVTYHGPGQLVLYPILDLRAHQEDLHWYMRSLEEVGIRTLARLGIPSPGRVEGLTGVWSGNEKYVAIGVKIRKWVTMHGLALNVAPNLEGFDRIVPCGISDKAVGSVLKHRQRGGREVGAEERTEMVEEAANALLESFAEVFSVHLCGADGRTLRESQEVAEVGESERRRIDGWVSAK